MGLGYISGIGGYIHEATNANFSAYCYDTVVIGTDADNVAFTLNGTTVKFPSGTWFLMKVGSVSATAGVFLIGAPMNAISGSQTLP